MNKVAFYNSIRVSLFNNKMSTSQVGGIEAILAGWTRSRETDLRRLAYMLATAYHEVSKTMQPIEESGKGRGRKYGNKLKMSGVPYVTPDKIYYGRGLVQLTWYENYQLMSRLLGVNLLANPELALDLNISVKIMFEGMLKASSSFGDFTGKCLEMYFNETTEDWEGARRIINGTDKAKLIAGYGKKFYAGLIAA